MVPLPDAGGRRPLAAAARPAAARRAAPVLPPPLKSEHGLAVRLDGPRVKVMNTRHDPVVVRRLEREGFEPLEFGVVVPPAARSTCPPATPAAAR